ncbi:hypothetical protein PAXINDRAFT_83068, partial [Paxillus involutus ATCC 200175]
VFVVILPLRMTGSTRQNISFEVSTPRTVMQSKGIIGEFRDPACLMTIQLLWFAEVFEVLVVCPDFKRVTRSHKEVVPFSKRSHDSE